MTTGSRWKIILFPVKLIIVYSNLLLWRSNRFTVSERKSNFMCKTVDGLDFNRFSNNYILFLRETLLVHYNLRQKVRPHISALSLYQFFFRTEPKHSVVPIERVTWLIWNINQILRTYLHSAGITNLAEFCAMTL